MAPFEVYPNVLSCILTSCGCVLEPHGPNKVVGVPPIGTPHAKATNNKGWWHASRPMLGEPTCLASSGIPILRQMGYKAIVCNLAT